MFSTPWVFNDLPIAPHIVFVLLYKKRPARSGRVGGFLSGRVGVRLYTYT